MNILTYPHPTLRHKSKPLRQVDANIGNIVRQMFELMYAERGVGLAANQVDFPFRIFIVNLTSDPDEGEELVFINPVLSRPKGNEEKEEGCLSLPELYGPVKRPESIHLNAYALSGEEIEADLSGLAARVVQHETDHLDGVLFIDRFSDTGTLAAKEHLEDFEREFQNLREQHVVPSDEAIGGRLREWEAKYC